MSLDVYVGVDIGGTSIKFGLLSHDGSVIGSSNIDQSDKSPDFVVNTIVSECLRLCHQFEVDISLQLKGVGVGCPGHIFNGMVMGAANFPGWKQVPLAEMIKQSLHIETVLMNDADAALAAEMWVGAACNRQNETIVMVTLGTGVGTAVSINGTLFRGSRGLMEYGHTILLTDTPLLCGCGQYGCIETLISATAIARRARLLLTKSPTESLTCQEIFQRSATCAICTSVIRQFIRTLAIVVINLTRTYDANIIILTGGVTEGLTLNDQYWLDELNNQVCSLSWNILPTVVHIKIASASSSSSGVGTIGAAFACMKHVNQHAY